MEKVCRKQKKQSLRLSKTRILWLKEKCHKENLWAEVKHFSSRKKVNLFQRHQISVKWYFWRLSLKHGRTAGFPFHAATLNWNNFPTKKSEGTIFWKTKCGSYGQMIQNFQLLSFQSNSANVNFSNQETYMDQMMRKLLYSLIFAPVPSLKKTKTSSHFVLQVRNRGWSCLRQTNLSLKS